MKGKAQGWMRIIATGYMKRGCSLCYDTGLGSEVRVFLSVLRRAKCNVIDRFLRLYFKCLAFILQVKFVSPERKHVNVSFNLEVRHFLCCRMGIMLFSSVGGMLN